MKPGVLVTLITLTMMKVTHVQNRTMMTLVLTLIKVIVIDVKTMTIIIGMIDKKKVLGLTRLVSSLSRYFFSRLSTRSSSSFNSCSTTAGPETERCGS